MNSTVKDATAVHGSDPQMLVQKILRERIYESGYWRKHLLGFPVDSAMQRAEELDHVGGCFGNQRPSPFLCLLLKFLQLGAYTDGHLHKLLASDSKYTVALGLFLFRLTCNDPVSIYSTLEPYLSDRRKLKCRQSDGTFSIKYFDEFVESLLGYYSDAFGFDGRVLAVQLPRLASRVKLQAEQRLPKREPLVRASSVVQDAPRLPAALPAGKTARKKKEKWKM